MEICTFMICGRPPSPHGSGTGLFRPPELFQKQKLSVLNQNETKFWQVIQMVLWRTVLKIYHRKIKMMILYNFLILKSFKALELTSHSAGDFYQFVWWPCSNRIGKTKSRQQTDTSGKKILRTLLLKNVFGPENKKFLEVKISSLANFESFCMNSKFCIIRDQRSSKCPKTGLLDSEGSKIISNLSTYYLERSERLKKSWSAPSPASSAKWEAWEFLVNLPPRAKREA